MASDRRRGSPGGFGWELLRLAVERVLLLLGFAPAPYGWVTRAVTRDVPVAVGLLRLLLRFAPRLTVVVGVVAVVAVLVVPTLPPNHKALRQRLDHLRLAGSTVGDVEEGGVFCIRGCPTVTRTLITEGTVEEATSLVHEALANGNPYVAPWQRDGHGRATTTAGAFHMRLTATIAAPGAPGPSIPDGHVSIVLRAEGTRDATPTV